MFSGWPGTQSVTRTSYLVPAPGPGELDMSRVTAGLGPPGSGPVTDRTTALPEFLDSVRATAPGAVSRIVNWYENIRYRAIEIQMSAAGSAGAEFVDLDSTVVTGLNSSFLAIDEDHGQRWKQDAALL